VTLGFGFAMAEPDAESCAPDRNRYQTASCHKTYFGEVHRLPASYFSMSAGAVADLHVASLEGVP